MNWREAFLAQARSDAEVRRLLNRSQASYCHQLHYLQMMTEKLSKAILVNPSTNQPPRFTHLQFVKCLKVLMGRPDIRRQLGYEDNKSAYAAMLTAFLPLADQIEKLAPSSAGLNQPNPEYPWMPSNQLQAIAPVDYAFPTFDPKNTLLNQLIHFIDHLMRVSL